VSGTTVASVDDSVSDGIHTDDNILTGNPSMLDVNDLVFLLASSLRLSFWFFSSIQSNQTYKQPQKILKTKHTFKYKKL